jgi:hypothetical protein
VIIVKLFGHISPHFVNFIELFIFQLFNQVKSRFLIISHVFVPRVGKLIVLESLSVFDIYKLPLLGNPHVMVLALLLIAAPPVKDSFKFIRHHVISCGLITLPHLIHYFEKSHDPLVGQEVDA